MVELIEELPGDWQRYRVSEKPSPTWTYRHRLLDVEVRVVTMDAEEAGKSDAECVYSISLQWSGGVVGAVEDFFDAPGGIHAEAEARDWTLALLTQIEQQFEPGRIDYVSDAMAATRGEQPSGDSSKRSTDGETCPVCDAPFFQFRGMGSYEQAQNHFEYMDDEDHEGWDISLTDK